VDEASRQFVEGARVARLATASAAGTPHVVPVCFALLADAVYIALDEKPKTVAPRRLRRVRNVIENPQAQLLVDRWSEDWTELAFVQLTGTASFIEPGAEGHSEAVQALRSKYEQYQSMALELRPLIRIRVQRTTSWSGRNRDD
jgi:coenzyme F420-0:L-glutamate ligase/coenzyme F420-1:gamma-L-glutamate ligase